MSKCSYSENATEETCAECAKKHNMPYLCCCLDVCGEYEFCRYCKGGNIESEGKAMTHEVEVTTTENRVIEEYWVMRAEKKNFQGSYIMTHIFLDEKELAHAPTLQEIAQFLSESKADFVSVEHNYRFADLPFC